MWKLTHRLRIERWSPGESGKVVSAVLANTGEEPLYVYKFCLEFDWHNRVWGRFQAKCRAIVQPSEHVGLPDIEFDVPCRIKPGDHSYKLGVYRQERSHDPGLSASRWGDGTLRWAKSVFRFHVVPHLPRNYRLFLSHSNESGDNELLGKLKNFLRNNGFNCRQAEEIARYGKHLWIHKIIPEIRHADRVVLLWTRAASRSHDVREEIGLAVGARRNIVPLVQRGCGLRGSLSGAEYVSLDPDSPVPGLVELTEKMIALANDKSTRSSLRPE